MQFLFDSGCACSGNGFLDLGMTLFVVKEPFGKAVSVAEGVSVVGVVNELGFAGFAHGEFLRESHCFGGDDIYV